MPSRTADAQPLRTSPRCSAGPPDGMDRIMRILVTGGPASSGRTVSDPARRAFPGFAGPHVTVLESSPTPGTSPTSNRSRGTRDTPSPTAISVTRPLLALLVPGHDAVLNFAAETHVTARSPMPRPSSPRTRRASRCSCRRACSHGVAGGVEVVSRRRGVAAASRRARGMKTRRWSRTLRTPRPGADGDLMARAYARTYGLSVSITRSANTYGPIPVPGEDHAAVRHPPA